MRKVAAICLIFLGFSPAVAMSASVSREKQDTSWAASVLSGPAGEMGATAWKMAAAADTTSASRLEQSQSATGVSRSPGMTGTVTGGRVYNSEEYIPVKRSNPAWKKASTAKMPKWERVINTEEMPDDTRKVIVGRVRHANRRVSVSRLYPDEENPADTKKLPPAKVYPAVNPEPVVAVAPPVSATKPVAASIPVPVPAVSPVKPPVQMAVIPAPQPVSSTPVTPVAPVVAPKPAPKNSPAAFMAATKPAPVVEEAPAPARAVSEKKTGVPVGADAKSEFISEMVVVSASGKTIRMTSYLMAKKLLSEGDFTGADRYARGWLESNPEDWRGWQLLGNIQVELGSYGRALNSYKKSLKLHPENATLRHYVNQAEGIEE